MHARARTRAGLTLVLASCAAPGAKAPAAPVDAGAAMFLPGPEFALTMRPQELAREGQAMSLQNAQAEGASTGLGSIMVRSEHVRLATRGAEVGMLIEGIPGELGVGDVVDEHGERLLSPCEGERRVPCFTDRSRRLYLLERGRWFLAAGSLAIGRAEAALRGDTTAAAPAAEGERVVWQATYTGDSLRRTIPKLRAGPLAPLASGLARVQMTKERHKDALDLVATYDTPAAAEEAEPTASRILSAWSRTRDDPTQRLAALERRGSTLRVQLRGALAADAQSSSRAPSPSTSP